MNVKNIIISTFIVAIVLWLAYAMHDKFERVTEEIDTGFQGEARSNSLYASRLFLKAMGIPAEPISFYQFDRLPDTNTVILINTHRTTLSAQRIDDLLNWVKQGGHLLTIVAPNYLQQDDYYDVLQRRLEITIADTERRLYWEDKDNKNKKEQEDKNKTTDKTKGNEDNKDKQSIYVQLQNTEKRYQLGITSFFSINSKVAKTKEERLQINGHTFSLNRSYGSGMVSLISDLTFAENKAIDQYDHAEFFWQLIHRHHATPSNVWLLNSDDMPALWQWLWQHASALIMSLALLTLFWFYRLAQRFGPLIPHRELNRRRILEHIQASGHFLWQHDQQQLIHSSRESVQQKFETLFPAWNQLNQEDQLQYASEHSQLSIDELQHLLYENKEFSMDEFIHLVQQLEKLRKNG